ncbi:MAG: thiol reductase thioredoxin, partial [Alloprevotella tannerae]|nr:thiol reductase thioredoxin [Alloprevotella tannerae]
MEKIITDANFESELNAGLPLVVDFSATWCGPCKKIAPIIDELAVEYDGRVNVGKCDVDENSDL